MDHLLCWWSWRSFTSCGSSTCTALDKASGWRRGWDTLTWQYEDVHEGLAVIEPCSHDTVCPQPLGSQLIHFPAGGNGVAAGHHPVVGGRGHNHPDPPYKTADKSSQVQAGGHHLCALGGRAGQDSARGGHRRDPGCWSGRDGRALAGPGPCSGSAASPGLPLPSSLPGRRQSCLQPHTHGRSKRGAPTSARASRASEGEGGCGEEEMRDHTQPRLKNNPEGFVQMQTARLLEI